MTNKQFYDLILQATRRPGDVNLRTSLLSEARGWLQMQERGSFHPWFLEKTSSGLVTVAATPTMVMPSDYLLLVEDARVRITDSSGAPQKLVRRYHEDIEDFYGNTTGFPEAYDIFEGKMHFGPTPDAIYPVRIKYYLGQAIPADDDIAVTNLWFLNAESFVVNSLAAILAGSYTRDKGLADDKGNLATMARNELYKYNESLKHVDMDYAVER